ncbi:MAG: T9SS type A sorting domain-containing protein, partial [Flavobacteriales bacterium]
KPTDCLLDGGTAIGGIPNGDAVVPAGYSKVYVLTTSPGAIIQQVRTVPIFDVTTEATYTIHTLVYDPATLDLTIVVPGVTSASTVNGLLVQGGGSICAGLDLVGTQILVANPSTGSITAVMDEVCITGGSATVAASPAAGTVVPDGYNVLYVLTNGAGLVIEDASATPEFEVNAVGSYTIHTLVYDPATLDLDVVQFGSTTGFDVNSLLFQGGGNICGVLDVGGAPVNVVECNTDCTAYAGTLSGFKPTDCLQEGGTAIGGISNGDKVVPAGYEVLYVLTSAPGAIIEQVSNVPIFDVLEEAVFTVHTLVYDPATLDLSTVQLGVTSAAAIHDLLIEGGGSICGSLDLVGTTIQVENPESGGLTAVEAQVCIVAGSAIISATPSGGLYVPNSYSVLYVLTQGPGLVILDTSSEPMFSVTELGDYTIHTLVYDPATLPLGGVVPGTTTGFDVNGMLLQGGGGICAVLDVAGAPIEVIECNVPCLTDAGSLSIGSFETCLVDGQAVVTAFVEDAPTVPTGYEVIYVLTSGTDLVLQQVSEDPNFFVSNDGTFTVHTLVYDPGTLDLSMVNLGVTTAAAVNALLIQGGGLICGSLDLVGATTLVIDCNIECFTHAGSLSGNETPCLLDGMATISATPNGDAVEPSGYTTIHVLTSGAGLIIQQTSTTPSFAISNTGLYTIHTLVYDANTLDLGIVVFGSTPASAVNELLLQGGGDICGSLDVTGASFVIEECTTDCIADAGTLTGNDAPCLEVSPVLVTAVANGDALEPAGYSTLFVLTSGDDLVIEAVSADPSFAVDMIGVYTIHTLVYDPSSLDLTIVEFGVTTASDVNAMLIQGGGDICAALDVDGASFTIEPCSTECIISAGSITGVNPLGCLSDGASTLIATPNGDAIIPPGFVQNYVLAYGPDLVIMQVGPNPSFLITTPGVYSMHSIVYNPATLDLSIIELGVSTAAEVVTYILLNGGNICAALDQTGAQYAIGNCLEPCLAKVHLIANGSGGCLVNGEITLSATPNASMMVPPGYTVAYILASGASAVIEEISPTASFTVTTPGAYSIHGLVYDPLTLDLSLITPGMSTMDAVHILLTQSDEPFCAGIDIPGVPFIVTDCGNIITQPTTAIWPVPVVDQLNVQVSERLTGHNSQVVLTILDAMGHQLLSEKVTGNATVPLSLNVLGLTPGTYTLRVQSVHGVESQRFVKIGQK